MTKKELIEVLSKYPDDTKVLVFRSEDWGANPNEAPDWHCELIVCDEISKLGYLSLVPQAPPSVGWAGCA